MANVLNCNIIAYEFEFQPYYDIHFWTNTFEKGMDPLIISAMGLIVPLLFFFKDSLGIR